MSRRPLILSVAALAAGSIGAGPAATQPSWSGSVTHICAHALLFEQRHQMGTRAGAEAVARDIRASTGRRLARIHALRVRPPQPQRAVRWLVVERRLAGVYATSYVRIYDVIASAHTAGQRASEPSRLRRLLDAPKALRRTADRLEVQLHVPDCTGGNPTDPTRPAVFITPALP
jgi:hypothetical protein